MIEINEKLLKDIHLHGVSTYPEEGAGFLVGTESNPRQVVAILPVKNMREDGSRHNRYLIEPLDYLKADNEATEMGLSLIGIFHSHPDHPNRPSEFDREGAQPFFSYIITSVNKGQAIESRSWQLLEDRSKFEEEPIDIHE